MQDDPNAGHSDGLRAFLKEHSDGRKGWLGRLTVLAHQHDPFRCDTPDGHRNAAWLREHLDEFDLGDGSIHLRGIHYAVLGKIKPNGDPYENDDPTADWLDRVAKQARWLGYVDFDRIHDERNTEPVVRVQPVDDPAGFWTAGADIEIPDVASVMPSANVVGFVGRQRHRLAFIGEKASLEPVLGPLAIRYGADLYLPSGEISDTQIHLLAQVAADDGRKLVVLYLSDCDPGGWQMAISAARKLQAFRASLFPEIEFELHRVALTPDQVREHDLPMTPLKATERRGDRWKERIGVEQTEIDALATLQPDLLHDLVCEAADQFFDWTLQQRVFQARAEWLRHAQEQFDQQIGADVRAEAERELRELRKRIDRLNSNLREAVSDSVEFPPITIPEPAPTNVDGLPYALIDSDWSFVEQTERLIAEKAYAD
jgi:hypothetical protein